MWNTLPGTTGGAGVSGTALYGTGADGSFTLTGGTLSSGPIQGPYTGGPSGNFYILIEDCNAVNVTLGSGYSLAGGADAITSGNAHAPSGACNLYCTGTLTIASGCYLYWNGYAGGVSSFIGVAGSAIYSATGSLDGYGGSAGGAGGTGHSGNGNGNPGNTGIAASNTGGGNGGGALVAGTWGNGGSAIYGSDNFSGGGGGAGGVATPITNRFDTLSTYLNGLNSRQQTVLGGTGGGAGGGGAAIGGGQIGGLGGGGGGGGPVVSWGCANIVNAGVIECNGGAGGPGAAGTGSGGGGSGAGGGGGGSGGGGGVLLLAYNSLTNTGTIQCVGGSGGAGGGSYGTGSSGNVGEQGASGQVIYLNNNA